MKNKRLLAGLRIFFGLLGLSSIVIEIMTLVGRGGFAPMNFFSFFTVEANIFAAAVLIASAFIPRNRSLTMLRGAATLYMVTTAIVFAVLLSGLDANVLTAVPWDNTVLHYIMPMVMIVDWLIDPPTFRISFKKALLWLAYPMVYVVYSLVRGAIVGWYPYPFLNPANKGYAGVIVVSIGIAVVTTGLCWVLTRVRRARA